ncbi:unnamed protein product [Gulo gulo]|uniref:Uncharacterized protein n=1 Tax=Gulo gulo TaxID=48420 RepID=A0A9X9M044_GULGU|nr:unnamed protein product [Gulo gulo]
MASLGLCRPAATNSGAWDLRIPVRWPQAEQPAAHGLPGQKWLERLAGAGIDRSPSPLPGGRRRRPT